MSSRSNCCDKLGGARLLRLASTKNLSYLLHDFKNRTYITLPDDSGVIFQRITLRFVSQATLKKVIRKCLLNLWSTWQKYIIDATSIYCFLIYLI